MDTHSRAFKMLNMSRGKANNPVEVTSAEGSEQTRVDVLEPVNDMGANLEGNEPTNQPESDVQPKNQVQSNPLKCIASGPDHQYALIQVIRLSELTRRG